MSAFRAILFLAALVSAFFLVTDSATVVWAVGLVLTTLMYIDQTITEHTTESDV